MEGLSISANMDHAVTLCCYYYSPSPPAGKLTSMTTSWFFILFHIPLKYQEDLGTRRPARATTMSATISTPVLGLSCNNLQSEAHST